MNTLSEIGFTVLAGLVALSGPVMAYLCLFA